MADSAVSSQGDLFVVTERQVTESRKALIKSGLAWGLSALLHISLVIICMGVGWDIGLVTGEGEADVTIVMEGERLIAGTPSELAGFDTPTTEVLHEMQTPQVQVTPIANLSVAPSDSTTETLVGIEVSTSGGVGAISGDEFSSLGAGGVAGGGDGASFFGLKARGNSFVFVVDRSSSMAREPLAAAKAELIRALAELSGRHEFYVIFYNRNAEPLPGTQLYRATPANLRMANTWINTISSSGGTDPTEAMKMALGLKPDVIWLLSDGQFSGRAVAEIRQANPGAKVQIHTIAFLSRSGESTLKSIAEQNRGNYRYVPR
jgi:hypothetical protein